MDQPNQANQFDGQKTVQSDSYLSRRDQALQKSYKQVSAKSSYAFTLKKTKPKQSSGPSIVDITLIEIINVIRTHKHGNIFKFSWLNELEKQFF